MKKIIGIIILILLGVAFFSPLIIKFGFWLTMLATGIALLFVIILGLGVFLITYDEE